MEEQVTQTAVHLNPLPRRTRRIKWLLTQPHSTSRKRLDMAGNKTRENIARQAQEHREAVERRHERNRKAAEARPNA